MQRISRRTPPKKAAKSHIYMQRISRRSPPEVAKLRFWTWKSAPTRGLEKRPGAYAAHSLWCWEGPPAAPGLARTCLLTYTNVHKACKNH